MLRAALPAVAALCIVSAVAAVWRAATEHDLEDRAAITADYVASCQSMTAACYRMADTAMHARKGCLDGRPGHRAMARGAVIWLNAHPETDPLPLADGMARVVAAVWPRCKA